MVFRPTKFLGTVLWMGVRLVPHRVQYPLHLRWLTILLTPMIFLTAGDKSLFLEDVRRCHFNEKSREKYGGLGDLEKTNQQVLAALYIQPPRDMARIVSIILFGIVFLTLKCTSVAQECIRLRLLRLGSRLDIIDCSIVLSPAAYWTSRREIVRRHVRHCHQAAFDTMWHERVNHRIPCWILDCSFSFGERCNERLAY